jgi:CTP synthase
MEEQESISDKGGTLRLGLFPCELLAGSLARKIYDQELIHERHRHRYEFNNKYRELFETHGIVFSGRSPGGSLVEILELPSHKYFMASQFHGEFRSRLNRPHPMFNEFVKMCKK